MKRGVSTSLEAWDRRHLMFQREHDKRVPLISSGRVFGFWQWVFGWFGK